MKKSRFTEAQIIAFLRQAEGGVPIPDLCREHGINTATFYGWRSKFGGMDASKVTEMKSIQEENRRLKKMFAELSIQNELLKEALGRK
jgi:putative transposase